MTLELRPASAFTTAELAELFNAGYEGYYVPMHVDEASLTSMHAAFDVDLDRSRVALRDDAPVGFAYLALRGEAGWIGGVGVATAERGRGTGRVLMEAVLAQAPGVVTLEVLEQNTPARRLYERLGFVQTRWLEVWTLAAAAPPAVARETEPRPLGQQDLPWQRADASIPDGCVRLEVDGGAILIRERGPQVNVVQLAARDEHAARELLAAARARGEVLQFVNVPEGDPASAALAQLGGERTLRQLELRLELSARSSAPRD